MTASGRIATEPVVGVLNRTAASPFVLVCEHASAHIPPAYDGLGLDADHLESHVVWDPGALAVARFIAERLDAKLIYSTVSRLVYDCNRAPDVPSAMPERSEVFDIPGNAGLSEADRVSRRNTYYDPFRDCVAFEIANTPKPILVTVHSFTPVYHGVARDVEIGILHDRDDRLALAMNERAKMQTTYDVQLNAPYGIEHGVTHTLQEHGVRHGHPNVMLEIRNDLIVTQVQQVEMAALLSDWLADALGPLHSESALQ